MTETEIIDNWLNKDLVEYLERYFTYGFPHYYGHKSSEEDPTCFYNAPLNQQDALNKYLFYKVKKTLNKNLECERMYINIQHFGMDGQFHKDETDLTVLYMVTKSLENDGHFQIKDEDKIDFVQNRLISFDAKKFHRGLAPTKPGDVKITLAFKLYVL